MGAIQKLGHKNNLNYNIITPEKFVAAQYIHHAPQIKDTCIIDRHPILLFEKGEVSSVYIAVKKNIFYMRIKHLEMGMH